MIEPWMILGAAAFLSAIVAFSVAFYRSDRSRAAFAAGFLNLLIATVHSGAPFRGWLDPQYVGYRFGLLSASQGAAVLLTAGLVFLCAAAAAFVAARNRRGRAMLVVAGTDAAFALNLGIGLVWNARTARDFEIQFGEFLTIPSAIGLPIILLVFLVPLLSTTVWAYRRAQPQAGPTRV